MGRDALELTVNGWRLIVDMNDCRLQLAIVTDDTPHIVRYVRLTPTQSRVLRDYLDDVVPATA
jgi:hypothetical protein